MPEQEPALATARVLILEPVRVRDRVQAFEPEPVLGPAFEQASAQVPVSVFELVRELAFELVRELASELERELASELERERASELERERASGLVREPGPVGVQPALWARCPWLCLSRWQWCRSAPARRQ